MNTMWILINHMECVYLPLLKTIFQDYIHKHLFFRAKFCICKGNNAFEDSNNQDLVQNFTLWVVFWNIYLCFIFFIIFNKQNFKSKYWIILLLTFTLFFHTFTLFHTYLFLPFRLFYKGLNIWLFLGNFFKFWHSLVWLLLHIENNYNHCF